MEGEKDCGNLKIAQTHIFQPPERKEIQPLRVHPERKRRKKSFAGLQGNPISLLGHAVDHDFVFQNAAVALDALRGADILLIADHQDAR